MMRDFVLRLIELLQSSTDGLSHDAVQRCGLIRCPFEFKRFHHADTVLVPPVPGARMLKEA
jgi:hypothetical protein